MVRNSIELGDIYFSHEQDEANLLNNWLKTNSINLVLFDLDETIIETSHVFETQKKLYINHLLSSITGYSYDYLLNQLNEIDKFYYKTVGVNPERWKKVVNKMAENFEVSQMELFISGLPILLQIYKEKPKCIEGANKILDAFLSSGVEMGLVTHANKEWTDHKLNALELKKYFSNILIADENSQKKSNDWYQAIKLSGYTPLNTMVIGDSMDSDIKPSAAIGVKKLIWIGDNNNSKNIPEGTIIIPNISKLITTLCNRYKNL